MSVLPLRPISAECHSQEQSRRQLDAVIYQHMEDSSLGATTLCREMGLSRSELYRRVRSLTGTSVNRYIRQLRLERAREVLALEKTMSIREVAFEVVFSDPSYFSRSFQQMYQVAPGALRRRAQVPPLD